MVQSLKDYGTSFLKKLFKLLIEDRTFFITISSVLNPDYFVETRYQFLYKILLNHFEKYHSIPSYETLESIFSHIKDFESKDAMMKLLDEIKESDYADMEYVKDETKLFCKHQTLKSYIIASTQKLKIHDYDGIEVDMMNAVKKIDLDHNLDHDYWDDFDDRVENIRRGIIPTGWPALDNALHGGLGIGELGVIVAPTGFGKSFSLVNIACGCVSSMKNCLFYSLELSDLNVGIRADAYFSGFKIDDISIERDKVKAILNEKKHNMGKFIIRRFPTKSKTVDQLKAYTNRLVATGFKPDLIIIDYGDLIKTVSTNETRIALQETYEDLRHWAGEDEYPIWTASQTNKVGLSKEYISIEDLAESFGKAMVADVIIGQTRSPLQKLQNEATFYLAKSRVGRDGIFFEGTFDTAYNKILISEVGEERVRELSGYGKEGKIKIPKNEKEKLKELLSDRNYK